MPKRSSTPSPCSPRCTAMNDEIRRDIQDPPLSPDHFLCVWRALEPRAQRRARSMSSVLASFSMDPEDMAQQIALALWEAVSEGRVRAARGFLEVWFTHAYGSVLRHERRRARFVATDEDALDEVDSSALVFGAGTASAEDAAIVNEALRLLVGEGGFSSQLPEGMRAALELSLDDQTGPEIAAALGTTPGAVRLRLMHARDRLREMFREAA